MGLSLCVIVGVLLSGGRHLPSANLLFVAALLKKFGLLMLGISQGSC